MNKVEIVKASPLFLTEEKEEYIAFGKEDYLLRIKALRDAMEYDEVDFCLIYGNREQFSNIEYLSGYDCRFEESLYLLPLSGDPAIFVGNEGMSYAELIPYPVKRILYQNLSLQGQPRHKLQPLKELLYECGVKAQKRLGIIGYKYMEDSFEGDPAQVYDIPAYMLEAAKATGAAVFNYTRIMTGLPGGIRMKIRTAKEIAWAEAAANRTCNAVIRMLKNLRPGITELELSKRAGVDLQPVSVHPMINFGTRNVAHGLRSPSDTPLVYGEVCGLCYGVRGSLTSKIGVAAYDEAGYADDLRKADSVESFYKPFWAAIAAWYEAVHSEAKTGEVTNAVTAYIGEPEFGLFLNPGHYISTDEWPNSSFQKGSKLLVGDGSHLQCDIIASSAQPVRTGICEDAIMVAGSSLQKQLQAEFPPVWERISHRRQTMKSVLGISLFEDVLPLSNLTGVYYPFMLNTGLVFGLR